MHLLVPFAAPLSEPGQQALSRLDLPNLRALLGLLDETGFDAGEVDSLSPPHERALARAWGLEPQDGCVPMAAWAAEVAGARAAAEDTGCALLWVTHWQLGSEQLSLMDPSVLALEAAESAALLESVRALFAPEGFGLQALDHTRWLLTHDEALDGLPTASLDRVVGRDVDPWMTPHPRARLLRRLQNEVQMSWHAHPVNAVREAAGRETANSVWISGLGRRPAAGFAGTPTIAEGLRGPALREDWQAWLQAWSDLDGGPLGELLVQARAGHESALTLCGERSSIELRLRRRGWVERLRGRWRGVDTQAVLGRL